MSNTPHRQGPAGTLPLGQALDHSIPLALLMQRLKASRDRFESIRNLLPGELQSAVRPGPLDESGWSLLADGSAAAAKLRQLLPLLQKQLQLAGHPELALRVKVQPRA
jgi:hypothetical protein